MGNEPHAWIARRTPSVSSNGSTRHYEDFPEQDNTAAGIDQRNHPLFIPLSYNPQVPAIKVVEMHLLHLQAQHLPHAHPRFVEQRQQQTIA
jgi:hypothetical protein